MLAYFKNLRIDKMWKESINRMVIMDKVERDVELTNEQKEYLENLKSSGEDGEKLAAFLCGKDDLFVGRVKHELKNLLGELPADLSTKENQQSLFPKRNRSWSKRIKGILLKYHKKAPAFKDTTPGQQVDFEMMTENNKNLDIKASKVAELIHKDILEKLSDEERKWLNAWASEKPAYRKFMNEITKVWLMDKPGYENIVSGVAQRLMKMNWKKMRGSSGSMNGN